MENSIKVLQKIKNRTTIWPSNSIFGWKTKENKTTKKKKKTPLIQNVYEQCMFIEQ